MVYCKLLFLCTILAGSSSATDETILYNLAFGSCNDQRHSQSFWNQISKPSLWLHLGDHVYADIKKPWYKWIVPPFSGFIPATPKKLKETYQKLLSNSDYTAFHNTVPSIGTWDDHDYGINNGDSTYEYRKESRDIFLDFINEPKDSIRRSQSNGIYTSYEYNASTGKVLVILLDTRYSKTPKTLLGEEQWDWLSSTLSSTTASIILIGSSIQVLPTDFRARTVECWGRYPEERTKLLDDLITDKRNGTTTVLLSGDVHFAEINSIMHKNTTIVEITSSGLTHSWLSFRAGASIMATLFKAVNFVLPFSSRVNPTSYYGDKNYGRLVFNNKSTITAEICSLVSNKAVIKHEINL